MTIPTTFNQTRRFVGLDLYHAPQDLADGCLTQADNVLVSGGELLVRPGKAGQLATPFANPIYAPMAYVKADGTTAIVFTSGGKLYQSAKGSTTASEILNGAASFALASANTFLERVGKFAYIVDGASPLYRTDLTSGATVQALTAPPTAPTDVLTDSVFDACSSATPWSGGTSLAGVQANLLGNGSFDTVASDSGSGASPTVWVGFGDSPDVKTAAESSGAMTPHSGTCAALFDNTGEGFKQDVTCPALGSGKVRAYDFSAWFHNAGRPGSNASLVVTLTAKDGSSNVLGQASFEFFPPVIGTAGDWRQLSHTFSFTSLATDPVTITVSLAGGAGNNGAGAVNYNLYVDDVSLIARADTLTVSNSTTPGPLRVSASGPYVSGGYLKRDYGAGTPKDFSHISHVAVSYNSTSGAGGIAQQIPMKLGFQPDGGAIVTTNPIAYSADGTYFAVDISTVPAATRAACRYLYLYVEEDLPAGTNLADVFDFGPITSAGNLSVGYADYTWVFTEVNATTDSNFGGAGDPASLANVVESNPSPVSLPLTPTLQEAEASLSAITVTTANAGSTTHFRVYRFGGVFSDGYGRLVATVKIGADYADSSGYVTWNHTAGTFLDNTPDSALLSAAILQYGRDPAPAGAQCLCAWQNRLWLAQGSTLYASWLIASGQDAGLYFNRVNLVNDPSNAIKGATFSVGGQDNDPIQRLIPYGTHLVVLKQRSVWIVTGNDPDSFVLQSYLLKAGVGCLAPRAACLVGNHVWFLGPNGVYQFDADIVEPMSVVLESVFSADLIPANGWAGCAMVYHGRRLYLIAPAPAGSVNSVAYVWDSRHNGWTRFLGMAMTGGVSLSSGADTDNLFLGGLDGQLYQMTGTSDVALPGGSAAAISFSVQSRAFGEEAVGLEYWRQNRALRAYFQARSPQAETVTLSVSDEDATTWSTTYAVNGLTTPRLKVSGQVRGNLLQVGLSGSVTSAVRVSSLALESAEGRLLS